MGNCCKFIKRSTRYHNEEKIDQIGYRQTDHANTNPIACNSDISLNKSNKSFSNHNYPNNNVYIGHPVHSLIPSGNHKYEQSASYENKSEDGNVSIPHIADFYPEDNNTVPADNPRTSTLFLPKACKFNLNKIEFLFD